MNIFPKDKKEDVITFGSLSGGACFRFAHGQGQDGNVIYMKLDTSKVDTLEHYDEMYVNPTNGEVFFCSEGARVNVVYVKAEEE